MWWKVCEKFFLEQSIIIQIKVSMTAVLKMDGVVILHLNVCVKTVSSTSGAWVKLENSRTDSESIFCSWKGPSKYLDAYKSRNKEIQRLWLLHNFTKGSNEQDFFLKCHCLVSRKNVYFLPWLKTSVLHLQSWRVDITS